MDSNIQVCAVYQTGIVRIYSSVPKQGPRRFIKELVFSSYSKALEFAIEFEDKQRQEEKQPTLLLTPSKLK